MASQTEIVNVALTALGLDRILSIDDDVETARAMKAVYDMKRDSELASNAWGFAIKRVKIPALTAAPGFGFASAFQLPSDYLSIVEVGEHFAMYSLRGDSSWFSIEDGKILADEGSPLSIRYVSRIENEGLFPPIFADALAYRLALTASTRLVGSNTVKEAVAAEYKEVIRRAMRSNAIEKPPQEIPDSSWWLARN